MCWFQRLALIGAAGGGLLAASLRVNLRLGQSLAELSFVLGWMSASRQVFLLLYPEEAAATCGGGLFYYWKQAEFYQFFRSGLVGGRECATDQSVFLGMQIPIWSLLAFTGIGLMYLVWIIARARHAIKKEAAPALSTA